MHLLKASYSQNFISRVGLVHICNWNEYFVKMLNGGEGRGQETGQRLGGEKRIGENPIY